MRNATRSWVVRGFLIVLASTFALFFGSGGTLFSGLANRPVATVGAIEIGQAEFADEYVRRYNRLEGRISPDQARQLGLPVQVLQEMIGGALLDNAAADLGVAVPNAVLAANIRGEVGNVSTAMYRDILYQQGFTVDEFENLIRRDLARGQILQTIAAPPPVPGVLVDTLYGYREERRVAVMITIPASAAGDIAPPELSMLTAFHLENRGRYTAPEFREITFVTLTPDDVIESIAVTESEIATEYELRLGAYTTTDRRDLSQLFFADRESAEAALRLIDNGVPFYLAPPGTPPLPTVDDMIAVLEREPGAVMQGPLAADAAAVRAREAAERVAEAEQAAADELRLGWMEAGDLPEAVADAVFETAVGELTPPLQSAFGWHIYRIEAAEYGGTRTLDEVRDELRDVLAREKAIGEMFDLSVALDDALAAGDTLEVVAIRMGLSLGKVTVDTTGRTPEGATPPSLPAFARFLPTAWATDEGRESRLIDTAEGGYFVLRVDRVDPPRDKRYDEVAVDVLEDWMEAERSGLVRDVAEAFAERAAMSGFADAAAADGYDTVTTTPFTRRGDGVDQPLARQLVSLLFGAAVGEPVLAPAADGAFEVAAVTEIVAANGDDGVEARAALAAQLGGAMGGDLLGQYDNALEAAFGIAIDSRALEQALEAATQALPAPAN
ncbi:MAG: SurA N-terminal domain-containing protein [Proteobacteria bacterium]|nr:SurA N-terminal domain-containing protein [Pseudomonadota bacterium]